MKRLIAGALVIFMSLPVMAETPSYNYIELGWQTVEVDAGPADIDGDGFNIGGSFEVANNWHVVAGFETFDLDFGADLQEFAIGGGYHTDISNTTSFFANLQWVSVEVDFNGVGSADESGIGATIGLRSNLNERVELSGAISYVDLGNGLDGTSVGASGWYFFTPEFALGLSAEFDDDVQEFGIGGRYFFDF